MDPSQLHWTPNTRVLLTTSTVVWAWKHQMRPFTDQFCIVKRYMCEAYSKSTDYTFCCQTVFPQNCPLDKQVVRHGTFILSNPITAFCCNLNFKASYKPGIPSLIWLKDVGFCWRNLILFTLMSEPLLTWERNSVITVRERSFGISAIFIQMSEVVIAGCRAATLLSNLLTSMLWCLVSYAGADRGQQMTHQPSIDISAPWQSPVSTIRSSPTQAQNTPAQKFKLNAVPLLHGSDLLLIVSKSTCASSCVFTRVCSLGRFNPSFILRWVHLSFRTELSRWMKVYMHCYNLDHRCNPAWVQADAYAVTSSTAQIHGFVLSLSTYLQGNSVTLKHPFIVQELK